MTHQVKLVYIIYIKIRMNVDNHLLYYVSIIKRWIKNDEKAKPKHCWNKKGFLKVKLLVKPNNIGTIKVVQET